MLALRQVYSTTNQQITIQLPTEFHCYQEVEIIVLPIEPKPLSTEEFVQRFAGAIPDFPDIEPIGNLQEPEDWM